MSYLIVDGKQLPPRTIPLLPMRPSTLDEWRRTASPAAARWVDAQGFAAAAGKCLAIPGPDGGVASVLFGMQPEGWLYQLASVFGQLPPGDYALQSDWSTDQCASAALGWGLADYRFERYRRDGGDAPAKACRLVLEAPLAEAIQPLLAAQRLVRDLVNTPSEHMGPAELADAAVAVADRHGARSRVITGDALLGHNFPAIHAVGRASSRAPRLIEFEWGEQDAPRVVLAGKGVCFDTGGLDLKNSSGMALMKKDMGGGAHALALAQLLMELQLPLRLQLLIPAVENSVAGNAYRPGDVIPTRKGLSVEIGNTDAEGRVVLADVLAYASEQSPELIVDFATLTGAARVALGTDLPALFSNRAEVAHAIQQAGAEAEDPLWTMPLYAPYRELIKSPIADLNNAGKSTFAGCITAALFLEHFVSPDTPWVHIDTFAWNHSSRPGRPEGGEALGLRSVFSYLKTRYA